MSAVHGNAYITGMGVRCAGWQAPASPAEGWVLWQCRHGHFKQPWKRQDMCIGRRNHRDSRKGGCHGGWAARCAASGVAAVAHNGDNSLEPWCAHGQHAAAASCTCPHPTETRQHSSRATCRHAFTHLLLPALPRQSTVSDHSRKMWLCTNVPRIPPHTGRLQRLQCQWQCLRPLDCLCQPPPCSPRGGPTGRRPASGAAASLRRWRCRRAAAARRRTTRGRT